MFVEWQHAAFRREVCRSSQGGGAHLQSAGHKARTGGRMERAQGGAAASTAMSAHWHACTHSPVRTKGQILLLMMSTGAEKPVTAECCAAQHKWGQRARAAGAHQLRDVHVASHRRCAWRKCAAAAPPVPLCQRLRPAACARVVVGKPPRCSAAMMSHGTSNAPACARVKATYLH